MYCTYTEQHAGVDVRLSRGGGDGGDVYPTKMGPNITSGMPENGKYSVRIMRAAVPHSKGLWPAGGRGFNMNQWKC